jgi:hypothetical protein
MPQALGLLLFTLGAPVGLVNAVAIGAFGASLVQVGVGIGLQLLGSLLIGKPTPPKPSDVKSNVREGTAARIRSYGQVRVGGVHAYIGAKHSKLVKVLAMGTGLISAVLQHWIDERIVTLGPDGYVVGDASDTGLDESRRVRIEYRLGTNDQVPYASLRTDIPNTWTVNHKGNGFPHAVCILKQPRSTQFSKVFPSQSGTKYSQTQQSAIVFDPRTNTMAYSENAALCIRDYLISPYGLNLPASVVDAEADQWIAAANACDDNIPLKAGGSEKRYRLGFTYALNERQADVLQRMLDCCDGAIFPGPSGGLALKVGKWEVPTVTLDNDVIGGIGGLTRGTTILTRYNTIKAQYTSRDHAYEEVDADPWVDDEAVSEQGEEARDIQLYASPSHSQTRRLMKLVLARLNPQEKFTAVCNLGGLAIMGERFVNVNYNKDGIVINGTFEVQGQPRYMMNDDSEIIGIEVELSSMQSSAYDWNAAVEEGTPPPLVLDDQDDDDELPVPTALNVVVATRNVQGQPLSYATITAVPDLDREDLSVFFEVSSDNGASYVEVPHDTDVNQAEYGPLADGITYLARARSTTVSKKQSEPTATFAFAAISVPPVALVAFSAGPASGANVPLTATANNDPLTKAIQFRRGGVGGTFAASTILTPVQYANANDTRNITDTPGFGSWAYWAAAASASGAVSTPTGPINISTPDYERAVAGDFSTTGPWILPALCTISGGKLNKAMGAASANVVEPFTPVVGATYEVIFTIDSITPGSVRAAFLGGTNVLSTPVRTAAGTYTQTLVAAAGNNQFGLVFAGSTAAVIDNVSLKRTA